MKKTISMVSGILALVCAVFVFSFPTMPSGSRNLMLLVGGVSILLCLGVNLIPKFLNRESEEEEEEEQEQGVPMAPREPTPSVPRMPEEGVVYPQQAATQEKIWVETMAAYKTAKGAVSAIQEEMAGLLHEEKTLQQQVTAAEQELRNLESQSAGAWLKYEAAGKLAVLQDDLAEVQGKISAASLRMADAEATRARAYRELSKLTR